jgi:Ca2+-binding RTX toxin-like protein
MIRRRLLLGVTALVCATVAAPGTAFTATVAHPMGAARVDFGAAPGEANHMTVTSSAGQLVITDRGPPSLQQIGDCTEMFGGDPQVVACPAAGVTELQLSGGDMDDELVNATALAAQVYGEGGHDILKGGSADDRLDGGPGPDELGGGSGNDRLYGATFQDPGAGADVDRLAGGSGDDWLFGSGGADQVDGGPGADQLEGAGGGDTLQGGEGPDGLIGGDGDDIEDGGPGDDAIGTEVTLGVVERSQGIGNDALLGGTGNDTLVPGPGPPMADADTISGGDGFDAVSYAARMTPVDVRKDGAADDGGLGERDDVGLDVERVSGGLASDTLHGGPGADVLEGGPGDDHVAGLDGDDSLLGDAGPGAGTDTLSGGPGADVVQGEGGGDALDGDAGEDAVQGGEGADTLRGGPGPDRVLGGSERDVVAYDTEPDVTVSLESRTGRTGLPGDRDRIDEVEDVDGGDQRDTLTGTNGANTLASGKGEDYVDGRRGKDQLDGGPSADVVAARDGARDDPVSCGAGKDLAIVDSRDPVVRRGPRRCEQVDRPNRNDPRPGWVYVHPRRCPSSEEGVGLALPAMHREVPLRYAILLASGFRGRRAPTLDVADCPARLTASPGKGPDASADLSGAAATIRQIPGRRVTTMLTVERPACAQSAGQAGEAARAPRRLRAKSRHRRARLKVAGRYSIGASFGTTWTTVEECSRTTTIVRRGRVKVYDRVKRRTVMVRAGHRYVARRKGSSR